VQSRDTLKSFNDSRQCREKRSLNGEIIFLTSILMKCIGHCWHVLDEIGSNKGLLDIHKLVNMVDSTMFLPSPILLSSSLMEYHFCGK
jgi:hypothetical protein